MVKSKTENVMEAKIGEPVKMVRVFVAIDEEFAW
jgi:hypothetical protein